MHLLQLSLCKALAEQQKAAEEAEEAKLKACLPISTPVVESRDVTGSVANTCNPCFMSL